MTSNVIKPDFPQISLSTESAKPTGPQQKGLKYAPVQSSTQDITQLSWKGFKNAIAASGPPTTPLGKFFDWLLNIREYPTEINPDDIVESPKKAETSYMRYLLEGGRAKEYQKTLWAIEVLYDRTISENNQTALCIADQLDGIFDDCQENLTPEISGGSVVPTCSDDHPAKIIPSTCLNEEETSTTPLYMEIVPGIYLNHTFSLGNSSTSPMEFDPDNTDVDASLVLHEDQWNFEPVLLGENCKSQLESSFRQHLWRHVESCFSGADERLSQHNSAKLYTKRPPFPTAVTTPFVFDSNPQQDALNLYYPHVRLEGEYSPMLMAMQWTIRVLPTSEKYLALQQCIIQTLDQRQTLCYDGSPPDPNAFWVNNCTNVHDLFYGSFYPSKFGLLGDLAKLPSASTPLFDEITLEHRIINTLIFAVDPTPSPPFFWPHGILNETKMSSPGYIEIIGKTFNETLLCLIAHCYPPSAETHERFKQCHLAPLSNEPSDQNKTSDQNKLVMLSLGFVSFTVLTVMVVRNLKRRVKWAAHENRIITKMPFH